MTTSSNTSWELNRDSLITAAYAKIGIPGEDNSLTNTQLTDGASRLNGIIALAVTNGMPLWKRVTQNVTPSTTSQVYTVADAIKVADVFLHDTGGVRYSLQEKSLYDFNRLPTNSIGIPVHYMFQPSIQGGTVSIWPLTSDTSTVSTKTIEIVYQKEFDGMFSSTDTFDFPAYWTMGLTYKLAVALAPEYGVPLQDRQLLIKEAELYWKEAADYGDEAGSLYIQPDRVR
jgi:hypothetical protein